MDQHHLGTIVAHELLALDADGVGHDDADLVAQHRADEGEADALVAGGGLDDDGILRDFALAHGLHDHVVGNSGLDGAAHVQALVLDQDPGCSLGHHAPKLHHGGVAHGVENVVIDHS